MRAPVHTPYASHPLALLAACFALGVLFARFINLPLIAPLGASVACAALSVHAVARRGHAAAAAVTLFVGLAFVCAGATLELAESRAVAVGRVQRFYDEGLIAPGEPVEVTGVLTSQPETAPDGVYLTLRVERLRFREMERAASGVVWLSAPARDGAAREQYEALELRYGARVRVLTLLSRAERFRNPGGSSLTEFLQRRGYDATGVVKSLLLIERLDDERVFLPLAWLYEWRQLLLAQLAMKFSPETGGVLQAALLGNRYYLSHDAAERFREAGTFHVLVISGLHISE